MTEEIVSVSTDHTETKTETKGPSTTSQEVIELDDGKYLKTSKTDTSTTNQTIVDTTVTQKRKRIVRNADISWENYSSRDLNAFEAFYPLFKKVPAEPIRSKGEDMPEQEELINEAAPVKEKLSEAGNEAAKLGESGDQVDIFCSHNIAEIAYANVLAAELKASEAGIDASQVSKASKNVVDVISSIAPTDRPPKSREEIVESIKRAISETKQMHTSFEESKETIKRTERSKTAEKNINKTVQKIEKNIEKVAEKMSDSMFGKAAVFFEERMETYHQMFYQASFVDTVAENQTNFTYSIGVLVSNLQQLIDANKGIEPKKKSSHKHKKNDDEPVEEQNPENAEEKQEEAPAEPKEEEPPHIQLQELARDEDDVSLSLGQSKNMSTSTDALVTKKEDKPLGLSGVGSKSVSLFLLQSKRKSILLEPSNLNLMRSPTCPHVTFNFEVNGPLDQDDEEEENEETSSPLLAQDQGKNEEEDTDEEVPLELFPAPINVPNFDSWDPTRIQKAIENPIRVPAVSLDKLKSGSAKRQKLGFSRTLTSTSLFVFNFSGLRIKEEPIEGIEESSEEISEERLEEIYMNIDKCKEEYFAVRLKSLDEKFFFFVKNEKMLTEAASVICTLEAQGKTTETLTNARSDLNILTSAYNNILEELDGKHWESPRDALRHIHTIIKIIIDDLNLAEEEFRESENKNANIDEVRDWKRYFTEVEQHVNAIDGAYDNAIVIMSHKFFEEIKSQWSSFGSIAERVDAETKRKTLVISHKTLISTSDFIVNYMGTAKDLRSDVTDVPKMTATLEAVRGKYGSIKVLRMRELAGLSGQVDTILNNISSEISTRSDIGLCDCDQFSQELQTITDRIEPVLPKVIGKPQFDTLLMFHEYVTVARNNLLTFLSHGVSDGDTDFIPLIKANQSDFKQLADQFHEEGADDKHKSKKEFCQKWEDQITQIKESFDLIEEVSVILPRNENRYEQISHYLADIVKHVRTIENQRFAHFANVSTTYNKMANSIGITIDYVKDMCAKLKKSKSESSSKVTPTSFVHGMQTETVSELEQNLSQTAKTVDLSAYDNGFIEELAETKANVASITSQAQNDNNFINQLTIVISQLLSAQIDALARNYNLGSKSTTVLYNLAVTYCLSVIELTPLIETALETRKLDEVKASVEKSVNSLNAIQQSYNDKDIYSDFAQKRLMIFAQTCKVLGHITKLNIHHLSSESKFNDSPLQNDMRQLTVAIAFFPKFPSTPASIALRDLIRHSHQDHEDEELELMPVLASETKFLARIQDIVQNFYGEADVRFFNMSQEEVQELKSSLVSLDSFEVDEREKIPTATVKRSLDVVSDNFHEYSAIISDSNANYTTDKLVSLTTSLTEVVSTFCRSALNIEHGDDVFFTHVHEFQRNYKELIETVSKHAEIGSQRLLTLQAKQQLTKVRVSIAKTSRRLALMEQLDSQESIESSQQALDTTLEILAKFAKLLYIARDNLNAELDKTKIQGPRRVMAEYACRSYECSAQTLLAVKNKVTGMTLRIKASELRGLVWSAQDLLDASDMIIADIRGILLDDIESIEFWIKASMQPIIDALSNITASIPPSLPQAAIIRRKVSVIHAKCEICVQPFQECRSFSSMQ